MSEARSGVGIGMGLLMAVMFGSVGAFAAWAIASTISDGLAARDWVRVRADVTAYATGLVAYNYKVGGKDYSGAKLQVGSVMQSSDVDAEVDERLRRAFSENKPTTVFVNPANPAESVVDPAVPWMLVVGLSPFALAFGGVGLGGLFIAFRSLVPAKKEDKSSLIESDAGSGLLVFWIFTFLWNAIAIPIAVLVLAEALQNGEWGALFVLLFPLIGLLLLLGAIASTWKWIFRGGATMKLQDAPPRLGRPFAATIVFARGVSAGETFRARLACVTPGQVDMSSPHWSADTTVRTIDGPRGRQAAVRLDVPSKPPGASGLGADENSHWRLELYRGDSQAGAYGFDIEMEPDPAAALDANADGDEGEEALESRSAGEALAPEVQKLMAMFGQPADGKNAQIATAVRRMTPEQRDAIARAASWAPRIKKLVIGFVVVIVLFQVVGVVVAIAFGS